MSGTPQPISPQAPQPAAAQGTGNGITVALVIVAWVVWLGVSLVADFLALLMFAFADAPGAAATAQAMIVPAFAWVAFTFVAGIVLLVLRRWWTIALAFVLAVSPPFAVFAGYNLFDGAGASPSSSSASGVASPSTTPAPRVPVPPGGFRPAPMSVPEQPDFRKAIDAYRTAATTRPVTSTTRP